MKGLEGITHISSGLKHAPEQEQIDRGASVLRILRQKLTCVDDGHERVDVSKVGLNECLTNFGGR